MSIDNQISAGFRLRHTLKGHHQFVTRFAWSPDGNIIASPSYDHTIKLWNTQTGQLLRTLTGHSGIVFSVAWSPDGRMLASGDEQTTRIWNVQTGLLMQIFEEHHGWINNVAWSPNGQLLASSNFQIIRLWTTQTWQPLDSLVGYATLIHNIAWSPDGLVLASASRNKTILLWNLQTGQSRILRGHTRPTYSLAWSPDGRMLASGSDDQTIRLWDPDTCRPVITLEGHTGPINCISFSYDGRLLASKAIDKTIRIWRTDTGDQIGQLLENSSNSWPPALAFHPNASILATTSEEDKAIRIWDIDVATLLSTIQAVPSVHYTTAKIALVGDSGVGKTGLGYRIAEERFLVTESTHGQQFWTVDKLGKIRTDGTLCEAILWDFAGQPNFRPIHSIFLDDIDLGLVLFDPSRLDTFAGVDYWLKQLLHEQQLRHTILVAARSDVSKLSISDIELEAFCHDRNVSGGFISVSAKTGEGIDTLLELIRQQIDWDAKPATVTTETFKRIKDYVLAFKANPVRINLLMNPEQLRTQLEATSQNWKFSDDEMMTAIEHLQDHGYIMILPRSSNEQSILLTPDVLINLAASYMLKAIANERGLGALEESRVIRNEYYFPETENLSSDERDTLLNAVTELFLNRNICFRDSVDNQTLLIFPSLIQENAPHLTEETLLVEDMTYIVTGKVENVYPALVVLLGYSPSYQRTHQWRNQAQYETKRGDICGFKQANNMSGEIELSLYYAKNTPDFVRYRFQGLFEEILYTHSIDIKRYPPIFCPKCSRQQERRTVIRRIHEEKIFLFCDECGEKISLSKLTEPIALNFEGLSAIAHDQTFSNMRTTYETALVRVKSFVRDRNDTVVPTCFVSYAWGVREHEQWVLRLTDDLHKADIDAVLDQLNNSSLGANVPRFISRIVQSDFVIVVGTPAYRQKYENKISKSGSMVAAEVDLINVRLTGTEEQKATVLPLLLAGDERTSFPPLLYRRLYSNFTHEKDYFVSLFDLVLTLYHIPFDDSIVRDLRAKLREEADAIAFEDGMSK